CHQEGLEHFDPSGVAGVAEYGARLVDDQEKLSARFSDVADLVREASYWAYQRNNVFRNVNAPAVPPKNPPWRASFAPGAVSRQGKFPRAWQNPHFHTVFLGRQIGGSSCFRVSVASTDSRQLRESTVPTLRILAASGRLIEQREI